MNLSKFVRQPDAALSVDAVFATSTIAASPTSFGLTTTIGTSLQTSAGTYAAAYQDYLEAESAYKKALEDKNLAKTNFANLFSTYLSQSYATPAVTNGSLASIGLDPKPERGPVTAPQTPLDLLVDAFSNGYAKFKWKRNGNSSATTFTLESKLEDGAWDQIWSGTRTRVELNGFTPGVMTSFRVYASKGDEVSQPSNIAVIYEEGETFDLANAA